MQLAENAYKARHVAQLLWKWKASEVFDESWYWHSHCNMHLKKLQIKTWQNWDWMQVQQIIKMLC